MSKRPLTRTEKVLLEKIATTSSQGVLTARRSRVRVGDEVDEHGQVEWTTTVTLSDVLPDA